MNRLTTLMTLALTLAVAPLQAGETSAKAADSVAIVEAVKATPVPSDDAKLAGIEVKVNINRAGADELATLLTGVGLKKAHAIVQYRTNHGKFKTADELANVRGIGLATVEKNRTRIEL